MTIRAWILHLRPRSWPIVFAHYFCGALVVIGNKGPAASLAGPVLLGGILWTVFLNGGTLALNSAFDRDEGDIGYLDHPPPPPKGLGLGALVLMGCGGLLAWWLLPRAYAWAISVCTVLSVLYSVPPIRLKAVAGADLLINMIGYGALTFAAGALATDLSATFDVALARRCWILAASFGMLFGAFYPMTQIYQIPEDAARGDLTLALKLGPARSLMFSLLCVVLCFGLQGLALMDSPSGTPSNPWIPVVSIIGNFGIWAGFILDWLRRHEQYPAKRGMYRALWLWAITDLTTALAFGFAV